jgi:signal transduction histidine kinase
MADRRLRGLAALHPQVFDGLLGVLIATLSIVMVVVGPGPDKDPRTLTAADITIAVLALVLITLRRRWPLPVLAVATAGALVVIVSDTPNPVLLAATYIALFTVAQLADRRTAWVVGGCTAVLLFLASALFSDNGWAEPETFGLLAWTGLAVAIGDGLRNRRAYVAAIEERALRAEQTRDEEGRRRVVEERLRIARELHDVVAHHIAMINVQAGVAAHVLRQQPDQAEEALGHVRKAARTVLDEISTLLGVLRHEDDPIESEPTRGLGRLSGLLDSLAAAGLHVEHRQEGSARELPAAVDLAAYRIVQESLTNAQKHGSDPAARLLLAYTPEGLRILISNSAADGDGGDGAGHGLVGMRERALSVGGTLQTGHDDDRFVVRAFLPSPEVRA